MTTAWRRLGRIFETSGQHPWMVSHAANPVAQVLPDGHVRIFFSARDAANRSHIAAAVFAWSATPRLVDLAAAPLVAPGSPGAFDDSGASMGCLVATNDTLWLYYLGWNLGVTVPWRNSIGLAVSRDGGRSFTKHSPAPIMDRHAADPFTLSYPWVLRDGARWRMWYGSHQSWGGAAHDMDHVLKYAEATDGLAWQRDGRPILPHAGPGEYAHARPCVVRDADRHHLWFTHRGDHYRIGHAESADGLAWHRTADALDVGPAGAWDAEMVAYPAVFDHDGARYMLYNGNGYGRTGFGLALLETR